MGFFDFFKPKKAAPSPSAKSKSGKVYSGRGEVSGKPTIISDLQMGMSTFGMSKAAQAQKLSEMGYSPSAIDSYQARTAATQERMRQESLAKQQRDRDDRPATSTPVVPKKTQAEIKKETEIAEGQARRKKFEQDKAERRRKFKARFGPSLLFSSLSLNS